MFYTLLMTANNKIVVEVFIQLGVATGEMDIVYANERVRELYIESMQRRLVYNNKICKGMDIIRVDEWIEYLISLDRAWRCAINYDEDSEMGIKRYLRSLNVLVDNSRITEKIFNISQIDHTNKFEVTKMNLRSLELIFEELQMNETNVEVPICNDSNNSEKDIPDIMEENSLLSEHILNENLGNGGEKDNWLDKSLDDSNDENEVAGKDDDNEMALEDEDTINQEGGVRERFKSMILEGLWKEHWDRDERICLIADKQNLEFFAERTVDDVIINDDLKFNLQKAINKSGLLFHIK